MDRGGLFRDHSTMDSPPRIHARRRRRASSRTNSGSKSLHRHLAFACLATAFGTLGVSAECLRHADQSRINKLLSDGTSLLFSLSRELTFSRFVRRTRYQNSTLPGADIRYHLAHHLHRQEPGDVDRRVPRGGGVEGKDHPAEGLDTGGWVTGQWFAQRDQRRRRGDHVCPLPTFALTLPLPALYRRGDCRRCAHVALKNLIIDGNRAKLGRVLPTDSPEEPSPLVLLGNNEGQVVRGCTVRDPR